jgi:hypothetical protein
MTVRKLDLLFRYFYDNKDEIDRSLLFDTVKEDFSRLNKPTSTKEMLVLIDQLVDDKYVTKRPGTQVDRSIKTGEITEKMPRPLYHISMKGILLMESLPEKYFFEPYRYMQDVEKKEKRAKIIENIPKRYWWIYNPIALVASLIIGYFIGEQ